MDNTITETRRPELANLNFRTFVIYRYARPERLGHRTPGVNAVATALLVLEDENFPENPLSSLEVVDYVHNAPAFAHRKVATGRMLREAFAEYRVWLSDLKNHIS